MAPLKESGKIQDLCTVTELKEWLFGRVADDNDIVIDDLQEEFNEQFEIEDQKKGIKGPKQWKENVERMAVYDGRPKDLEEGWAGPGQAGLGYLDGHVYVQ